jgi:hypothetical protein
MLLGRFGNTSGRPFLEGRLIIPRLSLTSDLSFILDTGADITYLMPGDAAVMSIDYRQLIVRAPALGVGGPALDYIEPAVAIFEDRRALYVYDIQLRIAAPRAELMSVPSLLGRNILDRWNIAYRPTSGLLRCQVVSADVIRPIAPGSSRPIVPLTSRE